MKHTLNLAVILFSCCIISCGQKSPEQEAKEQQQHDDSLKAAIVAEINSQNQLNTPVANNNAINTNSRVNISKQQVSDLLAKTNSITDAKLQLNQLNTLLVNAKAKLEYENNELTRVEQFHLGRNKNERELAIRNQDLRVQAYQNYVQKIQEAIIQLHEKINALQSEINNASN